MSPWNVIGLSSGHFLDWLMWEGPVHCGWCQSWEVFWSYIWKQGGKAIRSKPVVLHASVPVTKFLPWLPSTMERVLEVVSGNKTSFPSCFWSRYFYHFSRICYYAHIVVLSTLIRDASFLNGDSCWRELQMVRALRINESWVFNHNRDIYIIPSKAQETSWNSGQQECKSQRME